ATALEACLTNSPAADLAWWPGDISSGGLFDLYSDIVRELISQFVLLPSRGVHQYLECLPGPLGAYEVLGVRTQFALNVISEAIISLWSRSPLPRPTSNAQTLAIASWAGWVAHPRDGRLRRPLGVWPCRH